MQALMPSAMTYVRCIGVPLVSVFFFVLSSQDGGRVFCCGVVGHTSQAHPTRTSNADIIGDDQRSHAAARAHRVWAFRLCATAIARHTTSVP